MTQQSKHLGSNLKLGPTHFLSSFFSCLARYSPQDQPMLCVCHKEEENARCNRWHRAYARKCQSICKERLEWDKYHNQQQKEKKAQMIMVSLVHMQASGVYKS